MHIRAYTNIYTYTHMCTTCSECVADVYVGVKTHLCNIHTRPCTSAPVLVVYPVTWHSQRRAISRVCISNECMCLCVRARAYLSRSRSSCHSEYCFAQTRTSCVSSSSSPWFLLYIAALSRKCSLACVCERERECVRR